MLARFAVYPLVASYSYLLLAAVAVDAVATAVATAVVFAAGAVAPAAAMLVSNFVAIAMFVVAAFPVSCPIQRATSAPCPVHTANY